MGWFSIFFDKRLTLVNNTVFDNKGYYWEINSRCLLPSTATADRYAQATSNENLSIFTVDCSLKTVDCQYPTLVLSALGSDAPSRVPSGRSMMQSILPSVPFCASMMYPLDFKAFMVFSLNAFGS
jgi:hypothetical protein